MSYQSYLKQLKPCDECSSTDLRWCGISVRPYCSECKQWGRTNFGTAESAIKDWNENWERLQAKEDNLTLIETSQETIRQLTTEIANLQTTIRTLFSLK